MKTASPTMIALLNGNTNFLMADLWSFTLRNGTILNYTNADIDLTISTTTWKSKDVLCNGGRLTADVGLSTGTDEITCYPNAGASTSLVGTIPFLQAVQEGFFDRAVVTRKRTFMPTWGDTSAGAIMLFVGEIVDSTTTRTTAKMNSKDMRNLLNIYMPSRVYQPTCPWVFGDENCTFNRTSIAVTSIVSSISGSNINCSLSQSAGYFNNGTIRFTSGANNGLSRSVKTWIPGIVTLVAPFPVSPAVGDAFTITPGCTKNFAGATSSFAASAHTGSTNNYIYTGLSNAAGYFTGGTLQFTSGLNVGQVRTITSWSGGLAYCASGFPNTPKVGDACQLTAISSNTTGSCSGFSNTAHFGGQRFVPVPETSY